MSGSCELFQRGLGRSCTAEIEFDMYFHRKIWHQMTTILGLLVGIFHQMLLAVLNVLAFLALSSRTTGPSLFANRHRGHKKDFLALSHDKC